MKRESKRNTLFIEPKGSLVKNHVFGLPKDSVSQSHNHPVILVIKPHTKIFGKTNEKHVPSKKTRNQNMEFGKTMTKGSSDQLTKNVALPEP